MALGADVDGFAEAECVHRYGRLASVEIFRIGGEDLAVLGLDDVTPHPRWMQMGRRESAFERQMVFFARRKLVELQNFESKKISKVMRIAGIRRHVVFVNQSRIESGNECAAVLNVKLEPVGFPTGKEMK